MNSGQTELLQAHQSIGHGGITIQYILRQHLIQRITWN
jgi:hypothetical protein